MRALRSWPLRIVIAASLALIGAFIDHYVTHRSFLGPLIFGLIFLGWMLLSQYIGEAEQRRRTSARQQRSSRDERDASGG
jgi:hypothetical protein